MILDSIVRQKRNFNEHSKKDIQCATEFFREHSWGKDGCPFVLEYPYLTVPDMIKDKILYKTLGIQQEGLIDGR